MISRIFSATMAGGVGVIQRGLEHMAEATDLRVCGVGGYLLNMPGHRQCR